MTAPPQQAPQYTSPPSYLPAQPPKTNGLAVASMVLGIVALLPIFVGIVTGPVAIVLAVKAKKDMAFKGEGGYGLATTGLVTGILGSVGWGLFLLLMFMGALAGGV